MPHRMMAVVAILAATLGFAPAPIFRERPAPRGLLKQMQGTWVLTTSVGPNERRSTLVRIKGTTWTYVFVTNGIESEGTPTRIILNDDRRPATIDLELRNTDSGVTHYVLRGILVIEGKSLSVCYSPSSNPKRPATFAGARPWIAGRADDDASPCTMTLRKLE